MEIGCFGIYMAVYVYDRGNFDSATTGRKRRTQLCAVICSQIRFSLNIFKDFKWNLHIGEIAIQSGDEPLYVLPQIISFEYRKVLNSMRSVRDNCDTTAAHVHVIDVSHDLLKNNILHQKVWESCKG